VNLFEINMRFICLLLLGILSTPLHGAYLFKNGRFLNKRYAATLSVEEHYKKGLEALQQKKWNDAEDQLRTVMTSFEASSLAREARYYLAVVFYEKNELDLANEEFSSYLHESNSPSHFEDVYRYKLSIAKKLASGHRRRIFGSQSMPKIMSGRSLALDVFDQVASGLPNHELAATALLGKGELLRLDEEFDAAIDTYQTVLRRFKGTAFALQAFQGMSACYIDQTARQPQNLDALVLAEINLKECAKEFPQAKEIAQLEAELLKMREQYVTALYETGLLYERMEKPRASVLYYHLALTKLPSSSVATLCQQRLKELSEYVEELRLSIPS